MLVQFAHGVSGRVVDVDSRARGSARRLYSLAIPVVEVGDAADRLVGPLIFGVKPVVERALRRVDEIAGC